MIGAQTGFDSCLEETKRVHELIKGYMDALDDGALRVIASDKDVIDEDK
jgi:hypothetical protein